MSAQIPANGASNGGAPLTQGGRLHPVGDLAGRGIANVRLISQSQLDGAIREAVSTEILAVVDELPLSVSDREKLIERALARLGGSPLPAPTRTTVQAASPEPAATPAIDLDALSSRIIEEVGRLVSTNWRDEIQSAQDSQRSTIDRLESRIEALMGALDQVERLMERPSAAGAGPATPASSGALGGIKNELLEQLFEANLALRELEAGEDQ
ncbi:MAG: hypothetical protein ACO4BJ_08840 [Planctomycetota bacterium]|jgi:hypothetical protein